MTNYDWRARVRVTGKRNGWDCTLVDTPTFELRSDAQFGGIWSNARSAAIGARDIFAGLASNADQIHVTVSSLDGTELHAETFTGAI